MFLAFMRRSRQSPGIGRFFVRPASPHPAVALTSVVRRSQWFATDGFRLSSKRKLICAAKATVLKIRELLRESALLLYGGA
jgi:hypothetical protein